MNNNRIRLYCALLLMVLPSTIIASISISHAASLAWNANTEADLSGYKVYFGTSSQQYTSVVTLGKVTSIGLTDLDLYEGNTYYIALTAYDTSYNESAFAYELDFFADDEIHPDEDNCPHIYNPDQEDTIPPEGNGIGNACECHADSNCDTRVDLIDLMTLKREFMAPDCYTITCHADFNYDYKVNVADLMILYDELQRIDCPPYP